MGLVYGEVLDEQKENNRMNEEDKQTVLIALGVPFWFSYCAILTVITIRICQEIMK